LYCGTIGTLFAEYILSGELRTYIDEGYVGANVEGVLIWGTIYSFLLLPLNTFFARFICRHNDVMKNYRFYTIIWT